MASFLVAACVASVPAAALAASVQPSAYATVLTAKASPAGEARLQDRLTKLQDEIQALQSQVQALSSLEAPQDGLRCFLSVQPMPNLDGSPIPSGG